MEKALLQQFLAIIGGIVLVIVFLLVLGLIVVRWKLRRLMSQFEGMAEVAASGMGQIIPPMRVRLRPDNSHDWADAERIKSIGDQISDQGFVRIGTFSTVPETVPFEAWHDPERSIYATINEHPLSGIWIDFVSLGDDGSMFTVSSGPGDQFPRPDGFHLEHMTGAEPGPLLDGFLDSRPDVPAMQTSAESFPSAFEDAWRRLMDFRVEQGTPSHDEVRRLCFADTEDADDDAVDQVRAMWQTEIADVRQRQVRETFLTESGLTALEWDRMYDRVVFVLDDMSAARIAEWMLEFGGDDFDDEFGDPYEGLVERVNEMLAGASARSVFALLNFERDPDVRFEKVGDVNAPVPADVYLGPEFID